MNNRDEQDKQWYFTTFLDAIKFGFYLVVVGLITMTIYFKQCEPPKVQVPQVVEYECPIVADTVKHDWVKNENICIEKRLVYEQMINDIDR
jgi:hypothetical protein